MKKFLSLVLVLSLMLSLCACGGKPSNSGDASSQGNVQTSQPANPDETPENTEPPKKVVGERIPMGDEGPKPAQYMPTSWESGAVDPEEIFCSERMPVNMRNRKVTVSGTTKTGATLSFALTSKGDMTVFELETTDSDTSCKTKYFELDGEQYIYGKGTYRDEPINGLYHLVGAFADGPEDGFPVAYAEGEEPVDGDKEMDESTERPEPIAISSEPFVIDGYENFFDRYADGFISGKFDAKNVKSCEYTGLIGENDTFKVIMKDETALLAMVDHKTGWVSGVNITSGGDSAESLAVRIYYDVTETLDFDVTGAEDLLVSTAEMMLDYQISMISDNRGTSTDIGGSAD